MEIGEIIFSIFAVVFCTICSVYDIRTKTVPFFFLLAGLVFTAVSRLTFAHPLLEYKYWLITAACAGLFYFTVRLITWGKLGTADILFGLFQGLVLPVTGFIICLIIECITSAIAFLVLKICRKSFSSEQSESVKLPFIPFMAVGLIFSLLLYLI